MWVFQASAQYLGEEVAGWEDKDNHFVQLVHTMAQYCQQMADFSRGGTSLKVCLAGWTARASAPIAQMVCTIAELTIMIIKKIDISVPSQI